MARNKEEVQDHAIREMDKILRKHGNDKGDSLDQTLAEGLKKEEAWRKLSPEQQRSSVPFPDWNRNLKKFMVDTKRVCTSKGFETICVQNKAKLVDMHKSGLPMTEFKKFFAEKALALLNNF